MRFSERGFAPSLSFDDRRMMELFIELFIVLFSGVIGYRFCGHCIAVIRHGGPAGDGAESLQRSGHFIRHCLYVAWVRIVGVAGWRVGGGVFFSLGLFCSGGGFVSWVWDSFP